jgi:multicomponent Na+:H+ antiporter subunit E
VIVIVSAAVLALAWGFYTQSFTLPNLVLAFFAALVALLVVLGRRPWRRALTAWRVLVLALTFVWELIVSSIAVAAIVVRPGQPPRPGFLAYPLQVTGEGPITLLANLVTLTPGTFAVDVSEDGRTLFIHAINAEDPDAVLADIHDKYEKQIMGVFR